MPKRTPKPIATVRKHSSGATIAHLDTKDGNVVALGNLRVLITKEDGSWIAQGLEIDYAIDGETLRDAKQRFSTGLAMTIESHLRVHNGIDHLLQQAPDDVWAEYYAKRNSLRRFELSGVTMHPTLQKHLPFEKIDYYSVEGETDPAPVARRRLA